MSEISLNLISKHILRQRFTAILPKPAKIGDVIILKGKIKDDAKVFSVNFLPEYPLNVIYHFKTNFVSNNVTHNYKTVGKWNDEIIETNSWIPGPGHEFTLYFQFHDNEFLVYSGDENRGHQYRFAYQFDIGDIYSVQVWDDLDYISEVIFRYGKETN